MMILLTTQLQLPLPLMAVDGLLRRVGKSRILAVLEPRSLYGANSGKESLGWDLVEVLLRSISKSGAKHKLLTILRFW